MCRECDSVSLVAPREQMAPEILCDLLKMSQAGLQSPTLPSLRAEAESEERGPMDGSTALDDSTQLSMNLIVLSRLLGTTDEVLLAGVARSSKGAGLLNIVRFLFIEHAMALSRYSYDTLTSDDVERFFNATGSSVIKPQPYALLQIGKKLPHNFAVKAFQDMLNAIDAARTELRENAELDVAVFLMQRLGSLHLKTGLFATQFGSRV